MNACPRCGAVDRSGRLSVCPRCLLLGVGDHADAGGGGDHDGPDALPSLGIDGLTLLAELGRGGMGRVFRARDERLGRTVAVKLLRTESAGDGDFRARFSREARTLARLEHPGIVAVHDFGTTTDDQSYLVMQFVAGGSLAERLPQSPAAAIEIARQLCQALAYAHGRGVIHRDIKPENVLLADDGSAKLSDFGIARLLDPAADEGPLTRPSLVLGTPGYMAPESRAGAAPDPRMDIYAVGALLQHMLTGRHPADGSSRTAGAGTDTHAVPRALVPVIARAMALDPAQRTPTAAALAQELETLAPRFAAAPDADDDLPPEERTWRGAVALLAAVATAVALYAGLVSMTPRTQASDEVLPFIAFGNQRLPDGRVLTRARFEVWPTLGAAVATALALAAHGLLRRHWRLGGLGRPAPDRPLRGSRRVLKIGAVLFGVFLLREALEHLGAPGVASYIPVLGGSLELVMLYFLWDAVLEAEMSRRSLTREPRLWLGLLLSLFPPAFHLVALARLGR